MLAGIVRTSAARRRAALCRVGAAAVLVTGVAPAAAEAASYSGGVGGAPVFTIDGQRLNDRSGLGVNVASGNLLLNASDLEITGTGVNLVVGRTYNSRSSLTGPVGYGWGLSLGRDVRVTTLSTGDVEYLAPSGYRATFTKLADGSFRAPLALHAALTRGADGVLTLTFNGDQSKFRFGGPSGALSSVTDKKGNRISVAFDASNRMSTITDTQARNVTAGYDASGRLAQLTDVSARNTKYGYSAAGDLQTFTDGGGKVTTYGYDAAHNLTSIVDPRGNQTRISYDTSRRVTRIVRVTDTTAVTGPTTSYDYGTADTRCSGSGLSTTRVTDPRGNATVHCWDSEQRVVKSYDANGNRREVGFDADGNVTQQQNGSSISTSTFLEGGRLETVTTPTGAKSSLGYADPNHKFFPTSSTSAQGSSTKYSWANNSLSTITDGAGNKTTLTHNANGTISSSTTPKGAGLADPNPYKTTYAYDTKGNLTQIKHPAPLPPETFTYDGLSRLATHTDGKGQKRTYAYDGLDRVTRIDVRTSTGIIERTVNYVYDANGNRTSRNSPDGDTRTSSYDALNRLTSETGTEAGFSFTTTYTYDASGNLATFRDAGGTVSYSYDRVNNVATVTEPNGRVTSLGYNDRGARTSTAYPNGVTVTNTLDAADRITAIVAGTAGAAPLVNLTWSYRDAAGSDRSLRQTAEDKVAGLRTTYSYDTADRLREAHQVIAATGATKNRWTYAHDANGNRTTTTHNGTTKTSTFNAVNQLTQQGSSTAFAYDANGNATTTPGSNFDYGASDQTSKIGGYWGSYHEALDYQGVSYAGTDQWDMTFATHEGYLQGGQRYGIVRNSMLGITGFENPSESTAYTRDDNGTLLSVRDRESAASYYYVLDSIGSVVGITNGAGGLVLSRRYTPDGEIEQATESLSFRQPWGFTGAFHLPEWGVYKMGLRWYQPSTGRWTQQDSARQVHSARQANRYVYVGGDPINLTDPTGTHFIGDGWDYVKDRWDEQGDEITRGVKKFINVPQRFEQAWRCGWDLGANKWDECDPLEFLGFDVEPAY